MKSYIVSVKHGERIVGFNTNIKPVSSGKHYKIFVKNNSYITIPKKSCEIKEVENE